MSGPMGHQGMGQMGRQGMPNQMMPNQMMPNQGFCLNDQYNCGLSTEYIVKISLAYVSLPLDFAAL